MPPHPPSDYYSVIESPEVPVTSSFPYDSQLGERSLSENLTPSQYAKEQAQVRRDASRRDKFMECLKKDTVDISRSLYCIPALQAFDMLLWQASYAN
jgi:hypothetical protein